MESKNIIERHQEAIVGWITLVGAVIAFPFAINCLLSKRWLLGFVCLAVLVLFVRNATPSERARKSSKGRLALVPGIGLCLALCFFELGVTGAFWCYPAITLFYFILPQAQARWANVFLMLIIFPSAYSTLPLELTFRISATVFMVSLSSAIFVHLISLQHKELLRMAIVDPLTQVYNRSHLGSCLKSAQSRARRLGTPMTLVSLDIDHFKSVNDTYGHAAGDDVLREVAGLLSRRMRDSDFIFRTGGEEFLVLLEGTVQEKAMGVAEELRHRVMKAELIPGRRVTVSLGVAQLSEGEELEQWLKRSDRRLYQAKSEGRNRVVG